MLRNNKIQQNLSRSLPLLPKGKYNEKGELESYWNDLTIGQLKDLATNCYSIVSYSIPEPGEIRNSVHGEIKLNKNFKCLKCLTKGLVPWSNMPFPEYYTQIVWFQFLKKPREFSLDTKMSIITSENNVTALCALCYKTLSKNKESGSDYLIKNFHFEKESEVKVERKDKETGFKKNHKERKLLGKFSIPCVYFIEIKESFSPFRNIGIKIGKSKNFISRWKFHVKENPGNKLVLKGFIDGYSEEELFLHEKFKKYRIGLGGRETFGVTKEIITCIDTCISQNTIKNSQVFETCVFNKKIDKLHEFRDLISLNLDGVSIKIKEKELMDDILKDMRTL